ncbi:MAG: DUF1549 and DUF1553 domain-containing protein [Planctomycetota bacterium]|jgi:hypothetical protein
MRYLPFIVLALTCLAFPATSFAAESPVTFDRDVMAVLSKGGCNMGTCHGNKNGKGGFRLSLRGEDSDFDFAALTRGESGRRLNTNDAASSLLLLKPLMNVPHQGGRRFDLKSPEYRILRDWIAGGARRIADVPILRELIVEPRDVVLEEPIDEVQVRVEAVYSDGSHADVTRLAVYEPAEPNIAVSPAGLLTREAFATSVVNVRYLSRQVPVRVAFLRSNPGFVWQAPDGASTDTPSKIDEFIFARLKQLKMNPSAICDDVTFLRRAFLDLTGQLPTADQARQFVNTKAEDKRQRLVDQLLDSQGFADLQAQRWADLLRIEEKTLDRKGVQNFHAWVRHSIATNEPYDVFAQQIVSGRGSSYTNPPANYYRAMRNPAMRAESAAQVFLGLRLQCAKCHNHPFDEWTQNDYYGWGNLFARVDYEVIENRRKDRNDKHEFDGEQIVWMKRSGSVKHPDGREIAPRFLDSLRSEPQSNGDRLVALGEWLTATDNRRFAEVQVNRVWQQLMGRGLVDPIDDFRATNPPSHPTLLNHLVDEFITSEFDNRQLYRSILNSQTYQLSSEPNDSNRDDERHFAKGIVRRLTAEQLADAVAHVTGVPVAFNGYPIGLRATQIPGVRAIRPRDKAPASGDQFLTLFGKPPRLQSCECERSNETTLAQAFQLISGPLLNQMLSAPDNRLSTLLESSASDKAIIGSLYWQTLSRAPTDQEQATAMQLLTEATNRRSAVEDLAWALVNSAEFLLRR